MSPLLPVDDWLEALQDLGSQPLCQPLAVGIVQPPIAKNQLGLDVSQCSQIQGVG